MTEQLPISFADERYPDEKTFPHFTNSLLKAECGTKQRQPKLQFCGDHACRVREMQARVRFVPCRAQLPWRRSCVSSARLPGVRATLCGDRACRVREMQARVRFAGCARNPLRRSCVSSARKCRRECDLSGPRATFCRDRACRVRENAGESAICQLRAQCGGDFAVQLQNAE